MSKRGHRSDNSKRQQPVQQQRAQARNPAQGTSKAREEKKQQLREAGGKQPSEG